MSDLIQPILKPVSTITAWNRIEGRPRTEDFDRSLKAEIRDPLWMLSRQWQLGEFKGDDAASPVFAKVHMKKTGLTKYQAVDGPVQAMPESVPLEVQVEHQPIHFQLSGEIASVDIRLLMGRQWLKLVGQAGLPGNVFSDARTQYTSAYGFEAPDPNEKEDAFLCAHLESWQQLAAVAGKAMDGYGLYAYLRENTGHKPSDGIAALSDPTHAGAVDDLGKVFVQWFEKLYFQPSASGNPSWKPSYLEHQFACSAPQGNREKVLVADEYYQGHLDWYNLDVAETSTPLGAVEKGKTEEVEGETTLSFIPTGITFPGMPHTRWWRFEDSKTNFGDINPDTTDLNKLMLLDFGLQYANDWFLVPFTLPVGSIANVAGLAVTDVFGERIWVEAAGSGSDEDWQRWNMYSLSTRGGEDIPADLSLVLVPSLSKILEAPPSEETYLVRDEMANMVWGVETKVPLPTGKSKIGKEAARELNAKLKHFVEPVEQAPLLENEATIRYQLVNSVPEQWIPFIPVHLPGSNRQIQLQRGAMPRIFEGDPDPPQKVEPRTTLLREGLDREPREVYFLHEEEIPRAGTRVQKSYQRGRWYNGRVFNWIGIRKQTGKGEGFSGLAFDQILPVKAKG